MSSFKAKSNLKKPLGDAVEEQEHRKVSVKSVMTALKAIAGPVLDIVYTIKDTRDEKKRQYEKESIVLYGMALFTFRADSLRKAASINTNGFRRFMKHLGMGATAPPHTSTMTRFFSRVETDANKTDADLSTLLDKANTNAIIDLIRKKKFKHLMAPHKQYMIAIDGTGLHSSKTMWSQHLLRKRRTNDDGTELTVYSAYALHANLVFPDGTSLPLMSEMLENADIQTMETEKQKQDCEQNAFKRLCVNLKERMPKKPIMLLLDGLYATEPVMRICKENNWDYMVMLKEDSCPAIWREAEMLHKLDDMNENTLCFNWKGRQQHFWWVNGVEKEVQEEDSSGRRRRVLKPVNVVVCEETWVEKGKDGQPVEKKSRYIWLSGQQLNKGNVHMRCNLSARSRWQIEESNNREKTLEFGMEHLYSTNWQAYKCYHHLLRLGELVNAIALLMTCLTEIIVRIGETGFIRLFRETVCSGLLTEQWYRDHFTRPPQLRL